MEKEADTRGMIKNNYNNMKLVKNNSYLLLIDEETEIKEGDICIDSTGVIFKHENHFPISIGQRKIIAYRHLTKEAKELDLPELPPFEEDNIEKLADNYAVDTQKVHPADSFIAKQSYIAGYNAGQKSNKQYSLEDIQKAFEAGVTWHVNPNISELDDYTSFIQSLSTQQLPKEFVGGLSKKKCPYDFTSRCTIDRCDCEFIFETITNSEGKEILVGTYKY